MTTTTQSKRRSFIGRSPKPIQEEAFNPYEVANQQTHRRNDSFQQYNEPKVIINDDPIIPNYKVQEVFEKRTNYNMKLVVVGDGGCGKTCLLVSYAQQKFPEIYVPTVFENYVTTVQAPNGKTIELALWDTAGQEEYDRLRPLSYPDVDVLLICFSLESIVSLHNVKEIWYPEVNHFCPGIPIILVGTKSDLHSDIDPDVPIQLATEINAVGYIQCSAKTMFNIKTVFNFALSHFQRKMEVQEQYERTSRNRLSKVLGNGGGSNGNHHHHGSSHSRHLSSSSNRRGHLNSTSFDSTALLDQPLTEDTYSKNPYGEFNNHNNYNTENQINAPNSPYNDDEFAFTRKNKKKKRKCIIL
ncbi:GTP-binding RHO-like protein [Spathaspora sp. JA1]|nr:GTP-binding RHO-like protein [Spathaspora sp. JA1]